MISCKRATELLSKQMEEPLPLKDELALKLHLFICEFCEKFAQQIQLIRKALSSQRVDASDEPTPPAPHGAKERIKKKLRGELSGK